MKKEQLEKILDALMQSMASQKRCYYCQTSKNVVGHHLIRRANKLYRWNPNNILSVCMDCHRKIHDGKLEEPKKEQNPESLKDFLDKKGMTETEFVEKVYHRLTGKTITIEKEETPLMHLPKRKTRTKQQEELLEQQRAYRKEMYKKYKNIKKST